MFRLEICIRYTIFRSVLPNYLVRLHNTQKPTIISSMLAPHFSKSILFTATRSLRGMQRAAWTTAVAPYPRKKKKGLNNLFISFANHTIDNLPMTSWSSYFSFSFGHRPSPTAAILCWSRWTLIYLSGWGQEDFALRAQFSLTLRGHRMEFTSTFRWSSHACWICPFFWTVKLHFPLADTEFQLNTT